MVVLRALFKQDTRSLAFLLNQVKSTWSLYGRLSMRYKVIFKKKNLKKTF